MPYSIREKVEKELSRLVKEGTLEPVGYSDWAALIVAMLKSDKSVRVCGDFRMTVNSVSKLNIPLYLKWRTYSQIWKEKKPSQNRT